MNAKIISCAQGRGPGVPSSPGVPNTILIVDDDEIFRDQLGLIFESEHPLITAANGQDGLDRFYRNRARICAVLLDVDMGLGVMNGIEMLQDLARMQVPERIPIFLITGTTDKEIIRKAYDLGVMDVIPKPITAPRIVHRRVRSIIELFQRRNSLQLKVNDQQLELAHNYEQLQAQNRELATKTRQLEILNKGMVEALATATEFRSGESGEHVRRIHDITMLFLAKSPLRHHYGETEIELISQAAIMHDVGKISVPDAILNKPGRFTPEEFELMKTHTLEGERLLDQIPQMRGLPFYEHARRIARWHHERWDGRGYPDGLAGDDIPLCAQIVSLADVYDALVSPRVYKPPFDYDEALAMISAGKCGTFNPRLLGYFYDLEPEMRQLYAGAPSGAH